MTYVDRAEAMEMIEETASKFKEDVQISINSSKTYRRDNLFTKHRLPQLHRQKDLSYL